MFFRKIVFILLVLSTSLTFAQKVSQFEINKIAEKFFTDSERKDLIAQSPVINKVHSAKTNEILFYVLNYSDAYIVISANKNNIPVKAFSFSSKLNIAVKKSGVRMIDVLISDYENFNKFIGKNPKIIKENQNKWEEFFSENKKQKNINDETYGPFLSSLYGQVNCHDNNGTLVNVTNYYTPNNYAVGCVALTFTEVMRYYNWPRKGLGSYSYSDTYGSSTGTYSANFEEKYYNWSLILDEYDGTESTDQQRSELGRVAFHAAVSVSMDFENGGSTSNINRIPNAASKYFRYIADYKEKTASEFWQVLDSNMHHSNPVQFAIYTSGGAGHAVVGDGIKYISSEKYYHLNMGWWGDDNGWYQIHQSFNAGGYSNITAAVLNMLPVPELDDSPDFNFEDKIVNIKWYYPDKITAQNFELQYKKGTADWESLTDTITQKEFIFQADDENNYSIRIRAKNNDVWADNSWSDILSFKPGDFEIEGDEELTLYPTAASDELKVSYEKLTGSTVKIYNLRGSLVFQSDEDILINEYKINVSNFQTGFYILQISNDSERKATTFLKL